MDARAALSCGRVENILAMQFVAQTLAAVDARSAVRDLRRRVSSAQSPCSFSICPWSRSASCHIAVMHG